jgi:hypothetical protein
MLRPLRALLVLSLFAAPLAPACDNTVVAPLRDGLPECIELGEVCHDPGLVLGGQYDECHDIGHVEDGKACLEVYDECIALCESAHLGEGGAGGESHHEAGAGGESHAGGATH